MTPALRAVRPVDADEARLLRRYQRWLYRVTAMVCLAFLFAHGAAVLLAVGLSPVVWRNMLVLILLSAMGLEALIFGGVAASLINRVRRDLREGRVTEINGMLTGLQAHGQGFGIELGDLWLLLSPHQAEGLQPGRRTTVAIATRSRTVLRINGRLAPRDGQLPAGPGTPDP
jgi:hypothetical protein